MLSTHWIGTIKYGMNQGNSNVQVQDTAVSVDDMTAAQQAQLLLLLLDDML